ncbi:ABC transporter ATP-binding protein [Gordonia sinesedis]
MSRFVVGRGRLVVAVGCGLLAAVATVAVPFVSAWVTNILFAGVVGRLIRTGETAAQAADRLRAEGHPDLANLTSAPGVVPGAGIDWHQLWIAIVVLAGVYVLAAATRAAGDVVLTRVAQNTVRRLRSRVEERLHRLPVGAIDGTRRGEVVNSVSVDVDNVGTLIAPLFARLPVSLLTALGVFIGLFVLSGFFAALVLVSVPISLVIVILIARYSRPALERQWEYTATLTGRAEDIYGARDTLVALNARHAFTGEVGGIVQRLARASRTAQALGGSVTPALTAVNAAIFVTIAVLGAMRVLDGRMTLGALQAVIMLALQLSTPLSELSGIIPRIQSGLVSLRRVTTFLSTPAEPAPAIDDPPVDPTTTRGVARAPEIVFDDVVFAYGDDDPVLDGVSLRIRPGTTVAIAGVTGSGKTTLLSLLQRFADPARGTITVDGVDVTDLPRSVLRSGIATVAQDPWLARGTADDNVDYGGTARTARVERLLGILPNGGATPVSDGTELLSTGEKQLITVARALAADPAILILDEATSAADARTETLIQEGLRDLRDSTTTLVVSHRLSTLALADEIVVLHDGRIVEHGTLAELSEANGHFADMHGLSAQREGSVPGRRRGAHRRPEDE